MRRPRTVRSLPVVALLAALLAACSSGTTAGGTSPASAAGPSSSPGSTGTAPADPGVVVTLDDFATVNALSLGVTPDTAFDVFGYETSRALYREFGVSPQPYGQELDIEKIAAAKPDVIIGVSLPTTVAQKAVLERIAPTTIIEYAADWTTQLEQTAKALDRGATAQRLRQRLEADTAALRTDLAASPAAGSVVSVLADNQGLFSPPDRTALGSLLTAVGLQRPAAQKVATDASSPFVQISTENLTQHDAPTLFLLTGGPYTTKNVTASPLWGRLKAVTTQKVREVNGEQWLSSSPLGVAWVLADLRATLVDGAAPAPASQAGARLRQLQQAAG